MTTWMKLIPVGLVQPYNLLLVPKNLYNMSIGFQYYRRIPEIIQKLLKDDNGVLRIGQNWDISHFDADVNAWMTDIAFNILRENITFPDTMSEQAFDYSQHFFKNTVVVMPDGRMWAKKSGVPSGSYFMIDSIVNYLAVTYTQLNTWGTHFPPFVLGDDSAFSHPQALGIPDHTIVCKHMSDFGFTLHPEKCKTALRPSDFEYLGHTARGLRCDRPTDVALQLALFPEHPSLHPSVSVDRVRGLLVDTALNNWAIVHLYRYMVRKYNALLPTQEHTTHWLQNAMMWKYHPNDADILKAWLLT